MAVSDRLGGFVFPGYNPLEVPNPPTLNSAGVGVSASVAFTAPSEVGGGAITSYIALATNTSTGATVSVTGASSPLAFSGLTVGVLYAFTVVAVNAFGPSAASNTITQTIVVQGQAAYTTAGTYTWVAPASVTSVSVVAVGGGGGMMYRSGAGGTGAYGAGGGGGALAWRNNITVSAGTGYTVIIGAEGVSSSSGGAGGNSSAVFGSSTTQANGGAGGTGASNQTTAASFTGTGGGVGGKGATSKNSGGAFGGAGGAGGYTSQGGDSAYDGGAIINPTSGGGGSSFSGAGGVGILGQGANGSNSFNGGIGGSGGATGTAYYPVNDSSKGRGGAYGGGGGCQDNGGTPTTGFGNGGVGAVRILWPGDSRSFPSTNTGDV